MADLALVGLLVIIVIVAVGVTQVVLARRPHVHPNARWTVEEHPREVGSTGPTTYAIYCVHPDEERQLVDAVYWGDADFDNKLDEIRVEAQCRCDTLNRKFKLLRR